MGRLGYRPALDGVRAVSIALVVGYHAFKWPVNGWLGVDLFFVLSGFLITTLLLEEHAAGGVRLGAFFVRRARRLLPAMFVLILVVSILAAGSGFHPSGTVISLSYTTNLVLGYHWPVDSVTRPLGPLWSLATEDQFYLLWPVVLFVVLRGRQWAGAIVALAAVALMTMRMSTVDGPEHRLLFSPDTRPVGLAIGCLAAFAYAARADVFRTLRAIGPFALCLCLLLAVKDLSGGLFQGALTVFGLLAAVSIVAVVDGRSLLGRMLSLAPLVYVGRISYSLYLWHLPVLLAFGCVFDQEASTARRWVAVASCFAVAALSYHLVEQPFRRRRTPTLGAMPVAADAAG